MILQVAPKGAGDRADSLHRQLFERQLGNCGSAGEADQAGEGLNGAACLPRLGFEQAED